jgi:hypothetical protein
MIATVDLATLAWSRYSRHTGNSYRKLRSCVVNAEHSSWTPGRDGWWWAWSGNHQETIALCGPCRERIIAPTYGTALDVRRGPIPPRSCGKCGAMMDHAKRLPVSPTLATLVCLCGWEWYLTAG